MVLHLTHHNYQRVVVRWTYVCVCVCVCVWSYGQLVAECANVCKRIISAVDVLGELKDQFIMLLYTRHSLVKK